mmetsp:Transcript_47166/g.157173  ORF Transcript_47166/g.157173 Transcript_47166/m.157173 type:complete len:379 (+) Transcript_47166:217-1353(+)
MPRVKCIRTRELLEGERPPSLLKHGVQSVQQRPDALSVLLEGELARGGIAQHVRVHASRGRVARAIHRQRFDGRAVRRKVRVVVTARVTVAAVVEQREGREGAEELQLRPAASEVRLLARAGGRRAPVGQREGEELCARADVEEERVDGLGALLRRVRGLWAAAVVEPHVVVVARIGLDGSQLAVVDSVWVRAGVFGGEPVVGDEDASLRGIEHLAPFGRAVDADARHLCSHRLALAAGVARAPLATPHDVLVDDLADSEELTRPQGLLKRRQPREALDLGAPHQKHGKERPANDLWVALEDAGVGVLALEGAAVGKGLDGEALGAGSTSRKDDVRREDLEAARHADGLLAVGRGDVSRHHDLVREEVARALLQRSQL